MDGKIHADNTDGYGFITNLKNGAPEWSAKTGPALILGAGGAARAILDALITEETPKIYLTNRTKERAQDLANEFGSSIEVLDWDDRNSVLSEVKTLINTTSLGMNGEGDLGLDFSQLTNAMTVTDIVYTPLETELLKHAKQRGCTCVDGLGMLIYQGVPGFSNWFGVTPKITDELRELLLSERIVHPLVADDRQNFIETSVSDIVLLDIPLLFETNGDKHMDAIACVDIDPEIQRERVLQRSTMTEEQFEQILSKQLPNDVKCSQSDFVIRTDNLNHAKEQVTHIVELIRKDYINA